MDIMGLVGRFSDLGNGSKVQARLTDTGSLAVAQIEPPYTEMARAGRRFQGGCAVIAGGIAPVAAIPTTAAALALFNAAKAGGVSLILDWIAVVLGSGTAAAGGALYAAVCGTPVVVPTAAANYSISNAAGSPNKASAALFATGVTVVNPGGWSAIASLNELAAANVGQSFVQALDGKIVIPPQYVLALGILSAAGTSPLYAVSAGWSEVQLDLE